MVGAAIFAWSVLACACQAAAPADEVLNLPGLAQEIKFRHYSGYLNATGSIRLHYWFIESAGDPAKDPLILWLNGGPGCSSMEGLLNENGPFHVADDGQTIYLNPYSWNLIANVLYLEAPAGVGYSYSEDGETATDDDKTSLNNYVALKEFIKLYPEFSGNDIYLFGESYAGVYIPTLALRIAADPFFKHFTGIGVGNGLLDIKLNMNAVMYFAYYHGLVGTDAWAELFASCCLGTETHTCDFVGTAQTSPACNALLLNTLHDMEGYGLNKYNIYEDCAIIDTAREDSVVIPRRLMDITLAQLFKKPSPFELRKAEAMANGKNVQVELPCVNSSSMTKYLNDHRVRTALHVAETVPRWDICADLNYTTLYQNMTDQFLALLAQNKQIMVYNGDVDSVCNFLGGEWFTDALQQPVLSNTLPWYYQFKGTAQVGGFYKQFRNLKFLTIKGAGHMVPQDKPELALHVLATFLNDTCRFSKMRGRKDGRNRSPYEH